MFLQHLEEMCWSRFFVRQHRSNRGEGIPFPPSLKQLLWIMTHSSVRFHISGRFHSFSEVYKSVNKNIWDTHCTEIVIHQAAVAYHRSLKSLAPPFLPSLSQLFIYQNVDCKLLGAEDLSSWLPVLYKMPNK